MPPDSFFLLTLRRPPTPTLFPYTTLFRSTASAPPHPARRPSAYPWQRSSARHRRRSGRCCRSEEHTSELQSRQYLVCRLLLEKKKKGPAVKLRNQQLELRADDPELRTTDS